MHAHSDYTIKIKGNNDEKTAVAEAINQHLRGEYGFDKEGIMEVEDTYEVVWLEELQSMAVEMAKAAKGCEFTIEGVVDTSESAGEYMDFKIQYNEGTLASDNSCWYLDDSTETYGNDYRTFCKEREYEEGEEPITQEEFEDIVNNHFGYLFTLESGDGDIVFEVPLAKHEVISLWD